MRRTFIGCALGALLLSNPAAAVPGVDEPDIIKVQAVRNPELRKYKAILAGLDTFDEHRALAPGVPRLEFRVRHTSGRSVPAPTEPLRVRLEGDDSFLLPIALDDARVFTVPRSDAALAARSELVLNQKRRDYRIEPYVRTPGLPDHVRRLGDLRLECKVMMSIGKEEIPLIWVLAINGILRTRDWCGFFDERDYRLSFTTDAPLVSAILSEGNRSAALETSGRSFSIALNEPSWSDEALVELRYGEPGTNQAPAAATETAAGTPRTAP